MPSAKRKRQFQRMGRNGAAKAQATNRYPLRRVINEFAEFEPGVPAFELECGHKLHPPHDITGPRYPGRMRCFQCFKEVQGDGE